MINFDENGFFALLNSDFQVFVYKGDSSKSIFHFVTIFVGRSRIYREFRRLSDLRSFTLDILHLYGFTSLTVDIFNHPEEYMD